MIIANPPGSWDSAFYTGSPSRKANGWTVSSGFREHLYELKDAAVLRLLEVWAFPTSDPRREVPHDSPATENADGNPVRCARGFSRGNTVERAGHKCHSRTVSIPAAGVAQLRALRRLQSRTPPRTPAVHTGSSGAPGAGRAPV